MENITLRQAINDDWKILAKLEKSAGSKVFHPLTTEKEIKQYIRNSKVFFIILNGNEIGTVSFEEKSDDLIYFDGLTVLPEQRRKGIASCAIKKVLDDIPKGKKFSLVVHPENTSAIIVYLKMGFVIKEWKENYFGDGESRLYLNKSKE